MTTPPAMTAETTPLDRAHEAMAAAPEDDVARMSFYARLIEAELFLLLDEEPRDEDLHPRVFALESGPVVLAFDSEARLAAFAGAPAPYAALPGRLLVSMLAGQRPQQWGEQGGEQGGEQDLGLGLNLDVAPSAIMLPPEALDWLAQVVAQTPAQVTATPREFLPPTGLPDALLATLDARLARAADLAASAWLVGVRYDDGGRGHLLAVIDAVPGAEPVLARAVGEALALSGLEAGSLDVAFLPGDDAMIARLGRFGLRFDIPSAETRATAPVAPGSDPDRPPRLR